MKIDWGLVEICLARENLCATNLSDFFGIGNDTIRRIRRGEDVRPTTVHSVCVALKCDPADIVKR